MNSAAQNSSLLQKDQAHMIHPLHHSAAHGAGKVWVKGEGSYLIDADGNRFIDGLSCLWNVNAGHGRQELADVAARQMREMAFCSSYTGSSNIPAIDLANKLSEICYPDINHFYFTTNHSL